MEHQGKIQKLITVLEDPVQYQLPIGDALLPMNDLLGKKIQLSHNGDIHCIACDRKIKKSFNQGYCYPCFSSLAQCDICIIKPEQCHYSAGTCREPQWGEAHCLREHYVYLANSSGIKVGITRGTQIPTRWMDQGASQALPIVRVKNRLISGLVEVAMKNHVGDKTHWQRMLKGVPPPLDLTIKRDELFAACKQALDEIAQKYGDDAITRLVDEKLVNIHYPVSQYPEKVKSFNFDKTAEVCGVLNGIKGQYLIFDNGVLNMRKFAGYHLQICST